MKHRVGSLLIAALLTLGSFVAFHATTRAATECTAVPSQEHANVITVLPQNMGTLTAEGASGGIIQCEH
jgi:hypothetical protein